MTENGPAALHAEFAGRLKESVALRDAELATLDRGYSAILATMTPDIAAAYNRYAATRATAALRYAQAISSILDDYAQEARFGAPPLAAVAPAREGYPAPTTPLTPERPAASSTLPGRNRRKQSSRAATQFGERPTPIWRIAAMSVGGPLAVAVVLVAAAVFLAPTGSSRPVTPVSPTTTAGQPIPTVPELSPVNNIQSQLATKLVSALSRGGGGTAMEIVSPSVSFHYDGVMFALEGCRLTTAWYSSGSAPELSGEMTCRDGDLVALDVTFDANSRVTKVLGQGANTTFDSTVTTNRVY